MEISKDKWQVLMNSVMGIIAQLINILAQFIIRSFFIEYIGDELLGLDSTLLSLLSIFSLVEAGLSSSMAVFLVGPMIRRDESIINASLNTYRIIYKYMGVIYALAAFSSVIFIRSILKGIEVTESVYFYYFLLSVNGTLTYFLSYRRILLFADQKNYIQKIIDSICSLVFCILQIFTLVQTKSYVAYLIIKILQTSIGNIIIHIYTGKNYTFLRKEKLNQTLFSKAMSNMKQLLFGNIAAYVYNASDSLIISSFISTIDVAFYNNYFLIAGGIKSLMFSAFNAIIPWIKKKSIMEESEMYRTKIFQLYIYICFWFSLVVIVPSFVLIQPFIINWVGSDHLLNESIFVLMLIDLFICVVQNPMGNFIISDELFKLSKYPDMIGAVLNISISIMFVERFGLVGVLLGTIISRCVQWIVRGYIVFKNCLQYNKKQVEAFVIKTVYEFLVICLASFSTKMLCSRVLIPFFWGDFIMKGLISVVIAALFGSILCLAIPEHKILLRVLRGIVN